jgi:hypothetical protein
MLYREVIGNWRIDANGYIGTLQLWMTGNAAAGRLWLDAHQVWETLTAVSFNTSTDELAFNRGAQRYTGKLAFDTLRGQFVDGGRTYSWHAERAWPAETRQESTSPRVRFLTARPGAPTSPRVLVLVEERLLGPILSASGGGWSPFTRWLDDLQNEGWDAYAYTYDVRSDETGERGHRHRPSELLQLYRYIRDFYFAGGARLSGVVLVGDFPAAGICTFNDIPGVPGGRGELDYFCVDVMLADPFGYWEWQPLAPMVPPGSPQVIRLPYDEGAPPNFAFYPRTQWSAPGFVLMRQSEVHHSQRDPNKYGADPKYWIGRISMSQAAWRTGLQGWEWSEAEEVQLLMDYFNLNHTHRTIQRVRRGYIFLDKDFAGGWQAERTKMSAAIPAANITVHADTAAFPANQKASIANYIASFQQEYLICQYVMHSDWLNHYFAAESGQDVFPPNFPATYTSPGSTASISLLPSGSVKEAHILAVPNKNALSRFYLLGGCDVGKILFRPQSLVGMGGEQTSPATPLNRQYGAHMLGTAYLAHAKGLAVLTHNVTNPPGDYTVLFQSLQQNKPFGEAVLALMRAENSANLPHYRNVIFGDPTLKLSY